MNRRSFTSWLWLGLIASPNGQADPVRLSPVRDVQNSPIPSGLSQEAARLGLERGAAQAGWQVQTKGTDRLVATRVVRDQRAEVEIQFAPNRYFITYRDSTNLSFQDGRIQAIYNQWVHSLNEEIQRALLAVSR